jgi:hypothetical protein
LPVDRRGPSWTSLGVAKPATWHHLSVHRAFNRGPENKSTACPIHCRIVGDASSSFGQPHHRVLWDA